MAASYPTAAASFPARVNGNTIPNTDHNAPCDEIVAIEGAMLGGFAHWLKAHGMNIGAADAKTIAAGVITVDHGNVVVDTQGASAADDLDTINVSVPTYGPTIGAGALLLLSPASASRVVTAKDSTGNLKLTGGDFVFTALSSRLIVQYDGTNFNEVARSIEKGTWTPVIGGSGGTTGQTYGIQKGWWIKKGREVTAGCYIELTAKGMITTSVEIQGLPFLVENTTNQFIQATIPYFKNLATALSSLGGYASPNTSVVRLQAIAAAGSTDSADLTTTDVTNTTRFMMTITYPVKS